MRPMINKLLVVLFCAAMIGCHGDCGCEPVLDDCGCAPAAPASPCSDCGPSVSRRPSGIPDEAKPGEAWCKVFVPARYEDYTEQVLVTPACTRKEWVPPEYGERERRVCVRAARTRRVTTPAKFETVEEQVMTCRARTEWRRVNCDAPEAQQGRGGNCWMLVEIPAQYRTVTRRKLVEPASCRTETIPAEFKTITERVVTKAGYYKDVSTEPEYRTVTRRRLVEPCRWEWRRNDNCSIPAAGGEEEVVEEIEVVDG